VESEPRRVIRSAIALPVLASAALIALGIDQFSKFLVVTTMREGEVIPVLGPVLQWNFVRNSGAAFSLASGMTWIFTILAVIVAVVIVWFSRRIHSLSWAILLGLLLGGVLGNLTDRLFREPGFGRGEVVDFISMPWMLPAIYNMADASIVVSMGLFLLITLRGVRLDGSVEARGATTAPDADSNGTVELAAADPAH